MHENNTTKTTLLGKRVRVTKVVERIQSQSFAAPWRRVVVSRGVAWCRGVSRGVVMVFHAIYLQCRLNIEVQSRTTCPLFCRARPLSSFSELVSQFLMLLLQLYQ